MKHNLKRLTAFYIVLTILAAACIGCGSTAAKPESTQAAGQQTEEPSLPSGGTSNADAPAEQTEPAKTPEQKAILAYAGLLRSCPAIDRNAEQLEDLTFGYDENLAEFGKHYDYFAITDLNDDDIPELITGTIINYKWTPVSVFVYDASTAEPVLLKDPLAPEAHATFEQMSTAGGSYCLYICRYGHLHNVWSGDTPVGFQEENQAYVLAGDALAAVDCTVSISTEEESDIIVRFPEVFSVNDAETRDTVINALMAQNAA